MTTVKDFIKNVLTSIESAVDEVNFDIGTDDGNTVNMDSSNRVKFTLVRK